MIARPSIMIVMIVLMLALCMGPIARAEQLAPLAGGGAPPCPKHNGVREFHSAVVRDGDVSAFIIGVARRDPSACHRSIEIRVEQPSGTQGFVLPDSDLDIFIIDFSPDGSRLLLSAASSEEYPNEQYRYVALTTMPVATGVMSWLNAWELLGWKDCEATVEPQGFTLDGKLAVRARPSVMSQPRRANCVSSQELYAVDERSRKPTPISDAASIRRYGSVARLPTQACQSDPDLVGACFMVRGRLSAWNGAPTFRIARAGTKRILGVTELPFPSADDIVMPPPLGGKLSWDVEAFGDFRVCPFTAEKPGHMQMVCIESARNVTFKHR